MSDRVPISTFPGLVTPLLNVDRMVGPADVRKTITRVFLQRTDQTSGTITASVRNATAGGGEGIAVSITGSDGEATATGSVVVEATEPTYLRVSADDGISQNLSGWFEVEGSVAVTSLLTTLARVKTFLGISGTDDDDMLNDLISSVSSEIQGKLRRRFVQTTATSEKITSIGESELALANAPIVSVASVTEDGTALVEDTDWEATERDLKIGQLVRISGTAPIAWVKGRRVVTVTYDHGYASIPEAIVQAATELAAYDYRQAKRWFGLTGTVHATEGESTYRSRQQVFDAQKPRFAGFVQVAT